MNVFTAITILMAIVSAIGYIFGVRECFVTCGIMTIICGMYATITYLMFQFKKKK